ncbi:MAG: relaxase domain-containing protein [Nocardioides sp.]|uniref:relaxase domain-containing protein n=1 Tax=Nocardioides sp. TaxID=35761 RepID=UPI0039E5CA00
MGRRSSRGSPGSTWRTASRRAGFGRTRTRCGTSRSPSTGPKTWSLAAALHPEVSAALDAAQDRAAEQIVVFVAQHATTRVGPRGRQVQVPVERIEAAVIRHYTSRAGDPAWNGRVSEVGGKMEAEPERRRRWQATSPSDLTGSGAPATATSPARSTPVTSTARSTPSSG